MPELEFAATVVVHTSPEHAFDYFADHPHVAKVRYNVELVAMGFPLRSVLRLNRWRRPHEIGWVSESGVIKQEGGFTFTAVPEGVRVELRIAYVPPASVVGALVAGRLEGAVQERLQRAMDRIRDTLEAPPS